MDTHHLEGETPISDTSFFRSFTNVKYQVADISSYEGADFVFDICDEVPEELVGKFDFIIDGGSLDNVFDVLRMTQNMTRMLKPGGRIFIFAWSEGFPSAYLKITPDWMMDFCAVNEFADAKVYVSHCETPFGEPVYGKSVDLFHYDPLVPTENGEVFLPAHVSTFGYGSTYCIAEKGENTTVDRLGVQQHYRGTNVEPYLESAKRFHNSDRPVFSMPNQPANEIPNMAMPSKQPTIRPVARFGEPSILNESEFFVSRLSDISRHTESSSVRLQHLYTDIRSRLYNSEQNILTKMHMLQSGSTRLLIIASFFFAAGFAAALFCFLVAVWAIG